MSTTLGSSPTRATHVAAGFVGAAAFLLALHGGGVSGAAALPEARAPRDANAHPSADLSAGVTVARTGARSISVAEVEARLWAMAPFQRAAWGTTPDAIRRGFLLEVLIPEAVLDRAADDEKVEGRPPASYEAARARSNAMLRALRDRAGTPASIAADAVRAYYAQHQDEYNTPERHLLWRILCKTRDDAQAVIDVFEKNPTAKAFLELARERSIDKATYLRGGNLGFIDPEGRGTEPGIRVPNAIVRAVDSVRDGEWLRSPFPEEDNFAIVWRRGTQAAVHRSFEDAAPSIRDTLFKARIKSDADALLARLRTAHLRDLNEAPLASLP